MNRAWPAIPLLMIALGIGLFGLGVWVWFTPLVVQKAGPDIPEVAATSDVQVSPSTPSTVPKPAPIQKVSWLLAQSPYSPTREAFNRTPSRPPAPKAPEYQPHFVGLFGKGESARAMVIWRPGQPEKTHAVGDPTPWGTLVSASGDQLVFLDGDTERTLSLF